MDQQSELLPKDKHDDEAIKRLRKLPIQELEPLLPELLEWVADINWPIARDAIDLVLTVPEHIVEPIREVLRTTDDGWKNSCLNYVIPHLPVEQQRQLKPELERIAHQYDSLRWREPERRSTGASVVNVKVWWFAVATFTNTDGAPCRLNPPHAQNPPRLPFPSLSLPMEFVHRLNLLL